MSAWRLSLTHLGHQRSEQQLLLLQPRPQGAGHVSGRAFHVPGCSDGFVQWAVQESPPVSRRRRLSLFLTSEFCRCVLLIARRRTEWGRAQPEPRDGRKEMWHRLRPRQEKLLGGGLKLITHRRGSGHTYWRGEGGAAVQHLTVSATWWQAFVLACGNLWQSRNSKTA